MKINHDAYLKKFQLLLSDSPRAGVTVLNRFDCIVLKEAQDCTDAMLDIFICLQEVLTCCTFLQDVKYCFEMSMAHRGNMASQLPG